MHHQDVAAQCIGATTRGIVAGMWQKLGGLAVIESALSVDDPGNVVGQRAKVRQFCEPPGVRRRIGVFIGPGEVMRNVGGPAASGDHRHHV